MSKAQQNYNPEFIDSVKKYYDRILECRPDDPVNFAIQLYVMMNEKYRSVILFFLQVFKTNKARMQKLHMLSNRYLI